jgi:hypothetical protein
MISSYYFTSKSRRNKEWIWFKKSYRAVTPPGITFTDLSNNSFDFPNFNNNYFNIIPFIK